MFIFDADGVLPLFTVLVVEALLILIPGELFVGLDNCCIIEFNEPIFPSWLNPPMFTIPSHPVRGANILSPLSITDKGTPTQLEGLPLNRIALFTQCSA